jgi:hypothetical protein
VFLGGACNPTTWRADIACPLLEEPELAIYNPQRDDWDPWMIKAEADAKGAARVILFVIGSETRGIASMVEAAELIASGRDVVLALVDIPRGATIAGEKLGAAEIKDLNRGRAYLADVAERHGQTVYRTVLAAVREVVRRCGDLAQEEGSAIADPECRT